MAKDAKTKKIEEVYGAFMQATTLDTERKNLQYLTNELFKAAKRDYMEDKNNQDQDVTAMTSQGKTISLKNYGCLEHFNKFIETLKEREITIEGDHLVDLQTTYHALKGELKKTRVLGVGKNLSEKMKTVVANVFQRIIPKAILTAVGLGTGPILAVGLVATGITPVSETGKLRSKLKKQFKQAIHGETALTEAMGTAKKFGKMMLGINTAEEPKKLNKEKLWKKPTGKSASPN